MDTLGSRRKGAASERHSCLAKNEEETGYTLSGCKCPNPSTLKEKIAFRL